MIESTISVDKITKFSVRPPELSHLFDQVGNYYRWFSSDPKIMDREAMECGLDNDLNNSSWIDGFHRRIRVRLLALKDIFEYLESVDISDTHNHEMREVF